MSQILKEITNIISTDFHNRCVKIMRSNSSRGKVSSLLKERSKFTEMRRNNDKDDNIGTWVEVLSQCGFQECRQQGMNS